MIAIDPSKIPPSIKLRDLSTAVCGSTPVLTDSEACATWERRSYFLNAPYFTIPMQIRVCCFTWNVGSKRPNSETADQFDSILMAEPEILFVVLQEISMNLKSTVGGIDSVVSSEWEKQIIESLKKCFASYRLEYPNSLGGVFSAVLVKQTIPIDVTVSNPLAVRLGNRGMTANKSALLYPVKVGHHCLMTFAGCHLSAHSENVEARNHQLASLIRRAPSDTDYLFICGDLNYRLDMSYERAMKYIQKNDIKSLLEYDQFYKSKVNDPQINKLKEYEINFLPTYKFDPESDVYDTSSKHRTPSYTDRVLFKTSPKRLAIGSATNFTFETDIVQHFAPNILHNSSDSFSADSDPPTFPDDPLIEVYQRNSTRFSDHRPVQCLMRIWVPDEDPAKLEKFKNMRLRKLDEMSILAKPSLIADKTVINIQKGKFATITLKNNSISWARYKVIYPCDGDILKVMLTPNTNVILPGDTKSVEIHGLKVTKNPVFVVLGDINCTLVTLEINVISKAKNLSILLGIKS
ncbi:Endonuclease/Exonuclease/phosphatase family protein [Histomonas meleagridis]|nr:Endonuclease/Exonuclease/phosphatase family protein [Histomonas meleagridis]